MAFLGHSASGDVVFQQNDRDLKVGQLESLTVDTLTVNSGATLPAFDSLSVKSDGTSTLGTVTQGLWNGSGIEEVYGGTGQSSYVAGDILYADGANSLTVLPSGAEGEALQIIGGALSWSPITHPTIAVATITAPSGDVVSSDKYVMVSGIGLVSVWLPTSPAIGEEHVIKDQQGIAATSGITIEGNGNLIDGASSSSLSSDYASSSIVWDGSQWSIV